MSLRITQLIKNKERFVDYLVKNYGSAAEPIGKMFLIFALFSNMLIMVIPMFYLYENRNFGLTEFLLGLVLLPLLVL